MIGIRSFVYCVMMVLLCSSPLFAAQSTKDITASDQLKSQARSKVIGESGSGVQSQDPEYIIGYGDILEVQVYGEGSMAVSAPPVYAEGYGAEAASETAGTGIQVRVDGRASLKHIGDVEMVGMTLSQAADYLKILYATVYDDPIVTVVLQKSNSQVYTVMGKVLNPGVYNFDQPINLVQAIARSGGFTEWANSELTVVRNNGGKDAKLFDGNTLRFDYDEFLRGRNLERNIVIKSGDIIIVH